MLHQRQTQELLHLVNWERNSANHIYTKTLETEKVFCVEFGSNYCFSELCL